MAQTHFAVVTIKGMQDRFMIIDADLKTMKEHQMSGVMTEMETRAELSRRGHSDDEIDGLIEKAKQNPR